MENFLKDVENGRITQVPESSFEVGVDLAVTPGQVIFRNSLIELIQYAPSTPQVYATPILVVPPWINKYYVMDMKPENSMYKFLVDSGFTLFSISWKNPDPSILHLEWDDYVELGLLEAIRAVREITGSDRVNMVGYCLGGIIQEVTLAYLADRGDDTVNSATYFATHQDFTDVGDIAAFISEPEADFLDWLMTVSGGYLDGRNMAVTFNMLRSNDLLWHYVVNNYLLGKQPPSFDLLYWNNDGTRVPGKVHSYLIREFFLANKLKEPGGLVVKGVGIDTRKITVPTYTVAASNDHIVPWQGAYTMRNLVGGPLRFILTKGGHIAGIINPPGKKARPYWLNDDVELGPQEWFEGAAIHENSWWLDWVAWLAERSGEEVPPPHTGSEAFPVLMDAPGAYVLEK
jgi:poly[(R)-3-hydroxyalkanoate] polymerase subunit PhaC